MQSVIFDMHLSALQNYTLFPLRLLYHSGNLLHNYGPLSLHNEQIQSVVAEKCGLNHDARSYLRMKFLVG